MSPVQGISGAGASAAAAYATPRAFAVPAPKPEAQETAPDERTEVQRGTQEIGEGQAASSGNALVGSHINTTA